MNWRWVPSGQIIIEEITKILRRLRGHLTLALISLIVTIIGVIIGYLGGMSQANDIKRHYIEIKATLEYLIKVVEGQKKIIDKQKEEGKLSQDIMDSLKPKKNGGTVSRVSMEVTLDDKNLKRYTVVGKIDSLIKGRRLWIGTLSGLQFLPLIEMPPTIREGEFFEYHITIPPNISSGNLVLIDAGSKSNQLFKDHVVGQYYNVGLFWPHLKDANVIASVKF